MASSEEYFRRIRPDDVTWQQLVDDWGTFESVLGFPDGVSSSLVNCLRPVIDVVVIFSHAVIGSQTPETTDAHRRWQIGQRDIALL